MDAQILFRNALLNHLSAEDLALLRPHLDAVELSVRHRLAPPGRPIDRLYFLETGIASTTATIRHEVPIEIGMIGREGIVNLALLLATDRAPTDNFMQVAGSGYSISAVAMRAAMAKSPSLTAALLQFVHVFMMQMASTVLANGRANLAERLARWLLMAHDRIDGDALGLTHEFLAVMLGVRRPGVTLALRDLERRGLVAGRRGEVTIIDRTGLEKTANGYYGFAEAEMRRLFG